MALQTSWVTTTTQTETADRISNLPDDVLTRILSLVPTKDSISTRLVSTRWKHLFSLVHVLSFSNPPSFNPILFYPDDRSNYSCSRIETLAFLDFVDWVFNSYNVQNMQRFSFGVYELHPCYSRLLSWISESLRRGVKELSLNVSFREHQMLPRDLFTSKTLTYLNILNDNYRGHSLIVPEDACLPQLKHLRLLHVNFIDGDSFKRFFRSCTVLEILFLKYCRTGDSQVFDIFVPSLRTLTIMPPPKDEVHLVLDLPKVENFTCIGGIRKHGSYSFSGFELLVQAYICFDADSSEGYKAFEKIFSVICNAQKLNFTSISFQTSQKSGISLPIFCNLTQLDIDSISSIDSELVSDLLDRTPRLEVLVVGNWSHRAVDKRRHNIHFSSKRVPSCISLNLKVVTFDGFFMSDYEFKLVQYLLENAKVLDILTIRLSRGCREKKSEVWKKLMTFSRLSSACQIVFYDYPDMEKV